MCKSKVWYHSEHHRMVSSSTNVDIKVSLLQDSLRNAFRFSVVRHFLSRGKGGKEKKQE